MVSDTKFLKITDENKTNPNTKFFPISEVETNITAIWTVSSQQNFNFRQSTFENSDLKIDLKKRANFGKNYKRNTYQWA